MEGIPIVWNDGENLIRLGGVAWNIDNGNEKKSSNVSSEH